MYTRRFNLEKNNKIFIFTLLITFPVLTQNDQITDWYICGNPVYCHEFGPSRRIPSFLEVIQRGSVFPDSKTFVDMTQINDEQITLQKFDNMMKETNKKPPQSEIRKFIFRNFIFEPESNLWTPPDFSNSPAFLDRISDDNIKIFAEKLVAYWPILGRKTKEHVRRFPNQHSLFWVPNGFILPGGRFREQTYWDSYWIIKGLLILCEMKETVKGMLSNFVHLLKNERHPSNIPKGARIYYTCRPHPPLFAAMVALYMEQTNDIDWLKKNINSIDDHYTVYWLSRKIDVVNMNKKEYKLSRYGSPANLPRQEQWMEDTITCAVYEDRKAKMDCLQALKAGGDSGWDFSTRWMYDEEGGTNSSLSQMNVNRTIPVDLNAIICQAALFISGFYDKLGNRTQKEKFLNIYKQKVMDMEEVFYNHTDGMWYDFDIEKKRHRRYFYASNFAPLWTDCIYSRKKEYHGQRAAEYIYSQSADIYHGGVPTSLHRKGDQNWDFPNAWPPLQDIVVTGLYNTGNLEAKKLAKKFAHRFIVSSVKAWVSTEGGLYDKYSVVEPGMPGTGGDYPVQLGYGWSIGVALSFIDKFVCSARLLKPLLNSLFYITVSLSVITILRVFY